MKLNEVNWGPQAQKLRALGRGPGSGNGKTADAAQRAGALAGWSARPCSRAAPCPWSGGSRNGVSTTASR